MIMPMQLALSFMRVVFPLKFTNIPFICLLTPYVSQMTREVSLFIAIILHAYENLSYLNQSPVNSSILNRLK